jgi:hypothetical protein
VAVAGMLLLGAGTALFCFASIQSRSTPLRQGHTCGGRLPQAVSRRAVSIRGT